MLQLITRAMQTLTEFDRDHYDAMSKFYDEKLKYVKDSYLSARDAHRSGDGLLFDFKQRYLERVEISERREDLGVYRGARVGELVRKIRDQEQSVETYHRILIECRDKLVFWKEVREDLDRMWLRAYFNRHNYIAIQPLPERYMEHFSERATFGTHHTVLMLEEKEAVVLKLMMEANDA